MYRKMSITLVYGTGWMIVYVENDVGWKVVKKLGHWQKVLLAGREIRSWNHREMLGQCRGMLLTVKYRQK